MEPIAPAPVWKRTLAACLDFITAFFVIGFIIAGLFGGMTETGFNLQGWRAFVMFGAVAAYFYAGRRVLGGTLWDRILGIGRPQPH